MSDISQNDNFNLEQPRRGVTHAAQLTPHQRRRSAVWGWRKRHVWQRLETQQFPLPRNIFPLKHVCPYNILHQHFNRYEKNNPDHPSNRFGGGDLGATV